MSQDTGMTTLKTSCACENVTGSVEVPNSELPLKTAMCHCDSCRHQTGVLAASGAIVPQKYPVKWKGDSLVYYESSPALRRYFCKQCGTNMYMDSVPAEDIYLASGTIHEGGKYTKLDRHIYVGDTQDGGLATLLPEASSWMGYEDVTELVNPTALHVPAAKHAPGQEESPLNAHCHCNGVRFVITRPTFASREPFKGWEFFFSSHETKYVGGVCLCDSCRASNGYEIQQWAFVPIAHLFFAIDETHGSGINEQNHQKLTPATTAAAGKPGTGFSTLNHWRSSEKVTRWFCERCGATVFFVSDDRPLLMDVSVGLLDPPEGSGARLEGWLDWWTTHVGFEEDCKDQELVKQLKKGLKTLGEREGPKT